MTFKIPTINSFRNAELHLTHLEMQIRVYYQEYATATGDEIRHWAVQCTCTDSDIMNLIIAVLLPYENKISGFHSLHKYTLL